MLFALSKFEMRHLLGIKLCEAAQHKVEQFKPQNIADVLHAMAYFNFRDMPLISMLCDQAELMAHMFSDYDCSVLLAALDKLGVDDPEFVSLLSHGRDLKTETMTRNFREDEDNFSSEHEQNIRNFTALFSGKRTPTHNDY